MSSQTGGEISEISHGTWSGDVIEIIAWISNRIHAKLWHVYYSSMPNFNGYLVEPPLKTDMDESLLST